MKGITQVLILFPQILMSALVIMVDAIKLAPTALGATTAPVNQDTHKMAFMDVQVRMFYCTAYCVVYNFCCIRY